MVQKRKTTSGQVLLMYKAPGKYTLILWDWASHVQYCKLNCTEWAWPLTGSKAKERNPPPMRSTLTPKQHYWPLQNKHTTHPLAVVTRWKTSEIRNSTSITFHWVRGRAGLKGNDRADCLAETVANYNPTIAYGVMPTTRGKQTLEDHYTKIRNTIYVNSAKASHTKLFKPTIFHTLSLSLWPKLLLTQFLTNHGTFRSYLHKINKTPSPNSNCPEKAIHTPRHLMI